MEELGRKGAIEALVNEALLKEFSRRCCVTPALPLLRPAIAAISPRCCGNVPIHSHLMFCPHYQWTTPGGEGT